MTDLIHVVAETLPLWRTPAVALLAVEDHSAPIVATDYLAIAATYAALEEPTE